MAEWCSLAGHGVPIKLLMAQLVMGPIGILKAFLLLQATKYIAAESRPSWDVIVSPGSSFVRPPTAFVRSMPAHRGRVSDTKYKTLVGGVRALSRGAPIHRSVALFAKPKPTEEEMEKRREQLRELLCATESEIEKLVRHNPKVLHRRGIMQAYGPKLALLQEQFGISQKEAGKVYLHNNRMLGMSLASITETLEEMTNWIQAYLHLTDEELSILVRKFPKFLVLNPEENLEPKFRYLTKTFALNDNSLRDLLLRMPGLFTYSEKTIEKKLAFYSKLLGEKEARKLVAESPYFMVNYGLEKRLKPRLKEVLKSGKKVKWDKTLVSRLATRTDKQWEEYGLGDASEKTIDKRVAFYSRLLGEREAKRLIMQSPYFVINYSLEGRLKPRLEEVLKSGQKVKWDKRLVIRLATRTDKQWEEYGLGNKKLDR